MSKIQLKRVMVNVDRLLTKTSKVHVTTISVTGDLNLKQTDRVLL